MWKEVMQWWARKGGRRGRHECHSAGPTGGEEANEGQAQGVVGRQLKKALCSKLRSLSFTWKLKGVMAVDQGAAFRLVI